MAILRFNIKILKLLFLWPNRKNSRFRNYINKVILVMIPGWLASLCLAAFLHEFMNGIQEFDIIFQSIIALADFISFCFTYTCFSSKSNEIELIVQDVDVFFQFCDTKIIEEVEKRVAAYSKWAMVYLSVGVSVDCFTPLFLRDVCNEQRLSQIARERDPCGMSLRQWNPFKANGSIVFPILLIVEYMSIILTAIVVVAVTLCLLGFLVHIIAQFQELRKLTLVMFVDDKIETEKRVLFCIKYHISIINYANRVTKAFGVMMLIHICITSLVISMLGYLILNSADRIRYGMQLFGWIGLLFMTCYYGQKLDNESIATAESVYNSEWYCYEDVQNTQKNVALMIMRGQKAVELTASSMGAMALPRFLSIIKTAYSYFALLVTITEA